MSMQVIKEGNHLNISNTKHQIIVLYNLKEHTCSKMVPSLKFNIYNECAYSTTLIPLATDILQTNQKMQKYMQSAQ